MGPLDFGLDFDLNSPTCYVGQALMGLIPNILKFSWMNNLYIKKKNLIHVVGSWSNVLTKIPHWAGSRFGYVVLDSMLDLNTNWDSTPATEFRPWVWPKLQPGPNHIRKNGPRVGIRMSECSPEDYHFR